MRLALPFRVLCLFAALGPVAAAFTGGCSSDSKTTPCVPGQSVACTGAGACEGHQVCRPDGASFDACDCSGGGEGGPKIFPPTGQNSGLLGATCRSDANCRSPLTCLGADSQLVKGEGPSAGLCVASCAVNHDQCDTVEKGSHCVVLDDNGTPSEVSDDAAFCLPGCKLGTPSANDDKCRSRVDLVCNELTVKTGIGYCRPACRHDKDCGTRLCDVRTGLCADAKPEGDAIGAACSVEDSHCAGGCIAHGDSYSECSGVCALNTPGCGIEKTTPPYDAFCYLDPTGTSGAGDLGYCTKLCDCDDQCARADAVCEPHPSLEPTTGRKGVCGSKVFASGGNRPNLACK